MSDDDLIPLLREWLWSEQDDRVPARPADDDPPMAWMRYGEDKMRWLMREDA